MWWKSIAQSETLPVRAGRFLVVAAVSVTVLGGLSACASSGAETTPAAAGAAAAAPAEAAASAETAVAAESAAPAEEAAAASGDVEARAEAADETSSGPPAAEEKPAPYQDEQGRRYRLERYSKSHLHERLEDGRVVAVGGIPLEVDREDDEYFYYRVYAVERNPVRAPVGPSPEELSAAYANDTVAGDVLELRPFSDGLPESGQWRNGFSLVDMNGDGHLDIVHSVPRKAQSGPVVFLGDGAGQWRRWQGMRLPTKRYDYGDAGVADLDGDGRPDLVLGMHLTGLAALRSLGDGSFEDWGRGLAYEVAGQGGSARGFSTRAVAMVDWNRDGRPDIAALGEGPRMSTGAGSKPTESPRPREIESYGLIVYLNQGDGSWVPLSRGNEYGQNFGDSIVVGDFDGDGWPDLATGSNAMGTRGIVHLNREEGRSWETVDVAALRPRTYPRAVAAADVDGDGRDELFVAFMSFEGEAWRTGIELFHRAVEDGAWSRRPLYVEDGREGIWALATGDLDGDGRPDVAGTTGDGRSIILLARDGGYTLQQPGLEPFPGGCRGYHVAMADLDGDGRDELVEAFAGESNAMMDMLSKSKTCPSSGGLRAWDAEPSEAAAQPAR